MTAAIAAITPGVILLASSFLLIGRYRGGGAGPAAADPGRRHRARPRTRRRPGLSPSDLLKLARVLVSHGA